MSLDTYGWAADDRTVTDPLERFVLLTVADAAADDGKGTGWFRLRSIAYVADHTRIPKPEVERILARLRDRGLLGVEMDGDEPCYVVRYGRAA